MPYPVPDSNVQTIAQLKTDTARTGQFTVTTTPQRLVPSKSSRTAIAIVNNSGQSVFLGFDSTVTASAATGGNNPGYEILVGGTYNDEHYTGEYWLVVANTTSIISFLEE